MSDKTDAAFRLLREGKELYYRARYSSSVDKLTACCAALSQVGISPQESDIGTEAQYFMVFSLLLDGRNDEAKSTLDPLFDWTPHDFLSEDARQRAPKNHSLEKKWLRAHVSLGWYDFFVGDLDAAERAAQSALLDAKTLLSKNGRVLTPNHVAHAYTLYGDVLDARLMRVEQELAKESGGKERIDRFVSEVLRAYDAAIKLDESCKPEYRCPLAWNSKGTLLDRIGRRKDAVGCFKESLKRVPYLLEANVNLALALAGMGRHEQATKYFLKAVDINPDDKRVKDIQNQIDA